MDDPWDVKSVRQAGQYTSCMKLNGSPLLPPVLSKECREEMQYYKLLAKEVEKRIIILQPYVDSDTESNTEKNYISQISESKQICEIAQDAEATFDLSMEKVSHAVKQTTLDTDLPTSDFFELSSPNIVTTTDVDSTNFVIDFSLSINQTGRNVLETVKRKSPCPCPAIELPERDYNSVKHKELLFDVETNSKKHKQKKDKIVKDIVNFSFCVNKDELKNPFPDTILSLDEFPSLSCKNFTGSLNNIHAESVKETKKSPRLVRQRSYTLLKPSPQLLAHLEVQSLNRGIEMTCISMSESLSCLSSPNKKRRSWDLESAKVKWSSMAMELKSKQMPNSTKTTVNKTTVNPVVKKTAQAITSPPTVKPLVSDKIRRTISNSLSKTFPKSEPIQKRRPSPVRNISSNVTIVKGPASPKSESQKKRPPSPESPTPKPVSDTEDPATKVRQLYEKIQKQQLVQMANLVDKQKREQMLLQQVFEEQNSLLFKQLKTIVPKSSVEAKEAWGEKCVEPDRGPVSLSQLINHKSPEQSSVSSTLSCINKCDNVLKKSRDISGSIVKPKSVCHNSIKSSAKTPEGSKTRTYSPVSRTTSHSPTRNSPYSPVQRNTSRRLNYETSSERECDPILTDRTNDTMADLNVTFPTDNSDECEPYCHINAQLNHLCGKEVPVVHASPCPTSNTLHSTSTDSAIMCMERTIQNSINSTCVRRPKSNTNYKKATPRELAAATRIVAFAKGFLVRRLMRTERVTGIVQTIRDALLCALQLHQDREGIRGADVDLHRRLIQQITAACYSLHDTFIASSPSERCAMLAADRARRRVLASRPPVNTKHTDL